MVLLNLAYIPDAVVDGLDFGRPGWRVAFNERMDAYKEDWADGPKGWKNGDQAKRLMEEGSGAALCGEWKFQDEELEEAYRAFMRSPRHNYKYGRRVLSDHEDS